MSVFQTSRPNPIHSKPPGHFGGGNFGGPGLPDPMQPARRPSVGIDLLDNQCQAIQATLKNL